MSLKIILIIIEIILFSLAMGAIFGAIWIPTRKKDYERIAKLINIKPGITLYDLGSGSGGLLFYLSKKYNIKCVGIEIAPLFFLYSKIKSIFYKNVDIKYGSFFRFNLAEADVIYAFLLPRIYDKLKDKIKRSAKENAIIVLSVWPFKGIKPSRIDDEVNEANYYLYYKKTIS